MRVSVSAAVVPSRLYCNYSLIELVGNKSISEMALPAPLLQWEQGRIRIFATITSRVRVVLGRRMCVCGQKGFVNEWEEPCSHLEWCIGAQ